MIATYQETMDWIHNLLNHGMKPGLQRMDWMLDELGHPERRLRTIHIGGTNGKGSTVSFLRHMIQEGGWRVGTFTSPYVVRFNERISVNGEAISDNDLIDMARRVKPIADELGDSELGLPSEFEVITVMAILYFAEVAAPDFVLFEVGLGGRLDSTNVIAPMLSIITNIGRDHTEFLGNRIEQIATEKAGIIKSGTAVVTATDKPEGLEVIRTKSAEKNTKCYVLDETFSFTVHSAHPYGEMFDYRSPFSTRQHLMIPMKGYHQIQNASVALMAIDYLKQYYALVLDEDDLYKGLQKAGWPGRFEQISTSPLVIIDGAHNPEGVESLAQTLQRYYGDKPIHVLFAAMKDKNINGMLKPLYEVATKITFTSFPFERAAAATDLFQQSDFVNKREAEDGKKVLEHILQEKDEDIVYIVTGSLYFISEIRDFVKQD